MGIEGKRQYFGILADKWLYDFLAKDSKLKDRSKELYIGQWNVYVKPSSFYALPLDMITASTLQTFYNDLNAPASAVKAIDKVMKKFYRYLEFEGYARNITGYLVLPKDDKPVTKDNNKVVVWSDEEIKIILNSFDKAQKGFRLKFLLILAYNTGCRISELLALTYEDFENSAMSVNKQVINRPIFKRGEKTTYVMDVDPLKSKSSYRIIPLNSEVLAELEKHRAWQNRDMMKNGYRTNYLFTTNAGTLYDRHNIQYACGRYYARIGVEKKGFHTYRHTFGTNLCRKGVAIQIASSLLGHADINVTAKYYVDVSQDEKQQAVDLLAGVVTG